MATTKTKTAISPPLNIAPRVYSYERFSSPEQAKGDSKRRQDDAAQQIADELVMPLDDMLRMLDDGISAFRGAHRKKGILGKFLQQVEEGKVAPGSVLVIEEIRRLSREGVVKSFREILFKLWDHGITVMTVNPRGTYGPGCDTKPDFIALLIFLQQAHDESRYKSYANSQAWKENRRKAREHKKLLYGRHPGWLKKITVNGEEKLEVIPERAETVRTIFQLKLQGMGNKKIAAVLNETAQSTSWSKKNGWRHSYVTYVLRSLAVIGECQPCVMVDGKRVPEGEVIPDHYTPIVDAATFHAVQQKMAANKSKGGRTGKQGNVFTHLIKCAYCGASMRFRERYLICDRAVRKMGCSRHSVRYDELENTILEFAHKLNPEQVLPNQSDQEKLSQSLRHKVVGLEVEIAKTDRLIESLVDQLQDTTSGQESLRERLRLRYSQHEERTEALKRDLIEAERELRLADESRQTMENWQADLKRLRDALATGDATLRRRLNSHLRELIDRIEVFPIGFRQAWDNTLPPRGVRQKTVDGKPRRIIEGPDESQDEFAEWLDGVVEHYPKDTTSDEWREFKSYCLVRRMSKEGRFYRIHWRTGGYLDAVPLKSLASGLKVIGECLESITPDIEKLWTQFKAEKRRHAKRVKSNRYGSIFGPVGFGQFVMLTI